MRFSCLSGGTTISGSDEAASADGVLLKKKRRREVYRGHLSKLGKDITTFLNEFVPRNLFLIRKLKSYKNGVAKQIEQIKQLNDEIFELIQDEKNR